VNDWHIHTSTHGGMGHAFTGKQSVHLGFHRNASLPDLDTTRYKQLDAIKTANPVAMPLANANPELTFAHQISLLDNTSGVNVTFGEAVNRGVVEVQLAATGLPSGSWIKIFPYYNVYDEQGENDFSNCIFDPVDDGNNEDSFFDPTDPNRVLGPSSTCYPEFVFAQHGQTDYRKTFDVTDIGNASDGPGLQGCSGPGCLPANTPSTVSNPGTWVRPRFSLNQFAGRAIRLRFVFTSIEMGETQYDTRNIASDDGWFIDDIRIDQALTVPLTLNVDTATITPIPCGSCASVTPALVASPAGSSGPGQLVTLEARGSSVDRCLNGIVQYQFWVNANGNGVVGDAGDILLRDWTDNSTLIDAPLVTTPYGLKARCSTDTTCDAATSSIVLNVPVTCPSTATLSVASIRVGKTAGLGGAEPDANVTIDGWGGILSVSIVRGDLSALRSSGGVTNVESGGCIANAAFVASVADSSALSTGAAKYFLLRTPPACNVTGSGTYSENHASEVAGAGGSRNVDIAGDPDACP
jgi:hypothetical protein